MLYIFYSEYFVNQILLSLSREILPLDLRSWRNWKVIVPMGTIFTVAVAKGLKKCY